MRKQHKFWCAGLVAAGLLAAGGAPISMAQEATAPEQLIPWPESPYRAFGPARELSPTAILRDEADDPSLRRALTEELGRLSGELGQQGWPAPFAAGDPLRIYVARRQSEGVRRFAARAQERRRLVEPTIQIDASGLSDAQIVREAARLYALAVVSSYGVSDRGFVTTAAAEILSRSPDAAEGGEADRIAAAAPTVILADHPRTMGRALLEEFTAAAGGNGALRAVWDRASERAEDPLVSLVRVYAEKTGAAEDSLLVRAAARLYATLETETAPANLSLFDLEAGALDASAPAAWTFRHRVFLPAENAGALRFSWPAGSGSGAAVVRYRDPELPADVLFLEPGSAHTLALGGIARVDWIVAGPLDGAGPAVPVFFEPVAGYPFDGLVLRAAGGAQGSQISWTTSSHESLAGWAVFREEVQSDGRIARVGPQIVPSSKAASESFRYVYADTAVRPATFYRYTVWAVTEDGLLARAFAATFRTPE